MIKKTIDGRFIISAGEIGAYSVCPESWRLRSIEKAKTIKSESAKKGDELHVEWARNYAEAVYLKRGVRMVTCAILLIILVFAMR